MEQWDAYDAEFHKAAGVTLVRGGKIPEGLFHLVCDVLVEHADGTYLVMRRAPSKSFGGLWEATAGGSALAGETPLDCAVRELREETGIHTAHLTEVGRVLSEDARAIFVEFLCRTDGKKETVSLQPGETVDFKWVTRDELLHMKSGKVLTKRMRQFLEETLR